MLLEPSTSLTPHYAVPPSFGHWKLAQCFAAPPHALSLVSTRMTALQLNACFICHSCLSHKFNTATVTHLFYLFITLQGSRVIMSWALHIITLLGATVRCYNMDSVWTYNACTQDQKLLTGEKFKNVLFY